MLNTSDDKLLTEIGELFGRYRNEYGKLEFFQDKINKTYSGNVNQSFDEWLRYYSSHNPIKDKETSEPFLKGILSSSFYQERFYDWQKKVIERLQNTSNDIYVVAPPGGGKTTPLMAHYMVDIFMGGKNGDMLSLNASAVLDKSKQDNEVVQKWANIFHGLLTGKYLNGTPVPRCLFITPIRVLSFEQAEGFQEYFIDLLLFLKGLMETSTKRNPNERFIDYVMRLRDPKNSNIDRIVGMIFGSAGEERYNKLMPANDNDGKKFNSTVKSFTEKLICVKTGGGSGQFNDQPDNTLVSIATYGSAKGFISKISRVVKFIVFDEAHLYMPSEYGPSSDRSQENEVRAASDAYTIIEGMAKQKDAQIAFLSGTIHPESAQNFCEFLNRRYGRNLAVVSTEKGDTQSGNKTELHVIADDAIREEREQVNRIVKWVQNNEKGKAIILFSKRKIDKLVDEAIKRLSQKDIRQDFNVNQSDRYKKEKIDRFKRALAYSNPNASADTIKAEVDKFIEKEFPTQQQDMVKKIKAKPGAMMIKNKTLRNAVSYGIGYIYRQDEIEPNDPAAVVGETKEPIAEQDKIIVADLFSQGKINVLLATAAIGVGVNVNIRDMYLPSCMKFEKNKNNEGKFDLNNKREMSQLVNRTGRGRTPISGIYTPREFVPFMQDVVMSGAEDFNKVPAISVRPSDNLKDILLNLSAAASRTKNLPVGTYKKVSGSIAQKFNNFSGKLRNLYAGSSSNQTISNKPMSLSWSKERELNDIQNRIDRANRYQNTQDKISECETKNRTYSDEIKKLSKDIAECHDKLSGLGDSQKDRDTRKDLLETIARYSLMLQKVQRDQTICVVEEYNAIKKELDKIHSGSLGAMNIGSWNESRHRKADLEKRLNEIRKNYNPKLLAKRDESIAELHRTLEAENKTMRDLTKLYERYVKNTNVPQSELKKILNDIVNTEKEIQKAIDKIKNINYY